MKYTLLFATLFVSIISHAQLQVKGIVKMEDGVSLPAASVLLLSSANSSLVRGQVSDANGLYSISVPEPGSYFISISAVGFVKESSKVFQLNKSNSPYQVGEIVARENVSELGEVIVVGEKPMFEQKIDRTIISVQSNISRAGGTALDILQRSPGVTVDKMNYAISLSGKQGVRIMINGRISRLPMAAVVQMLEGMNAENIERIELITTPPSKYEAEGDAGMINIVMKKMEDIGTNGSLSIFTGYGRTAKYGGTLNVNHRTKKLNVFGDLTNRNTYVPNNTLTDDGLFQSMAN
jgi:Carboxypeptidase regulatory-like domain